MTAIKYGIAVDGEPVELSDSIQRHIKFHEYRIRTPKDAALCEETDCYAHGPDYGEDEWYETLCELAKQPGARVINIHPRPDDEFTLCGQGSDLGCGRRLVNTQCADQRCDFCGAPLLATQLPPDVAFRSLEQIVLELGAVSEELCSAGKRLVLENTFEPPHVMRRLLDRLPDVGFTLDVGHALIYHQNVLDYVYLLRDRLCHLHLHDNMGGDSETYHDRHLPPGFGRANWPALARALKQIGFKGSATFECMPSSGWIEYFEREMTG